MIEVRRSHRIIQSGFQSKFSFILIAMVPGSDSRLALPNVAHWCTEGITPTLIALGNHPYAALGPH